MLNREKWIDYTKIISCFLVATGHLFMSMVESGIASETQQYSWLIKTLYYFHVQLFFLCSGYLYQKNSTVTSYVDWKKNVLYKAVTLGIPYFVFSFATWILKEFFSGSVNTQNKDLVTTLFLEPASPYWYLYTLFFIFLITPRFKNKKTAFWGICAATVLKFIPLSSILTIDVYAISNTFEYLVWFVLGMCLEIFDFSAYLGKNKRLAGIVCGAVFLILSCMKWSSMGIMPFLMGVLGCMAVVLNMYDLCLKPCTERVLDILVRYTMPVYLMHTIFAAGIRSVMMKLSITNYWIHLAVGFSASFIGPMIAADIMTRTKLDFLMYPGKYLKKNR